MMAEHAQDLTLISSVNEDIATEYSQIPIPILESIYNIRNYCNLMLNSFDIASKQISYYLYSQNCTKLLFNDQIKLFAKAFLNIMFINNQNFLNEDNMVQFGNHWRMYVVCRQRSRRIVFVDGGERLIIFYLKNSNYN